MPRTNIPVQTLPPYGGGIASVTKTAGDAANGHEFINDGKTKLYVQNGDASTKTFTVSSIADPYGRVKDTGPLTVAAVSGVVPGDGIAGPFDPALFGQAGGKVNVDLSASTNVKVWVVSG